MPAEVKFEWRFIILLTLGVGTAVGLVIAILDSVFGKSFPTILGGLISAIIIVIVLTLRNSTPKT